MNLSPRSRWSTARMRVSPRAFSARTRFEPMNPAAPVTTRSMWFESLSVLSQRDEKFLRLDHRRAELPDHDSGRPVGDAHRVAQRHARAEHYPQRGDDRVARAAHVEHFAGPGRLLAPLVPFLQGHALFAPRKQQRCQAERVAPFLDLCGQLLVERTAP